MPQAAEKGVVSAKKKKKKKGLGLQTHLHCGAARPSHSRNYRYKQVRMIYEFLTSVRRKPPEGKRQVEPPSLNPNSELEDQPSLTLVVLPSPSPPLPPRRSPDPKSTPGSASLSVQSPTEGTGTSRVLPPDTPPWPKALNSPAVSPALPTQEGPEPPTLSDPRTTRDCKWSANPKTRMQNAVKGRRRGLRVMRMRVLQLANDGPSGVPSRFRAAGIPFCVGLSSSWAPLAAIPLPLLSFYLSEVELL